jgi:DNA-binding transcriptional LysR family regulator
MIELNHLRYFYEVAKAGSFTGAARSLRISQSALSKTVALLEAREGVKLLQRSKSGVTLTALGAAVFEQAEEIFAAAAAVRTTFRNHKEVCEGTLRLGASDHIVNYLLAPRAGALHRKYPSLLPSVFAGTPPEVADKILKNELEFGLSFKKMNIPGLVYEATRSLEMAIVYKPGLLPAGKGKSSAELLENAGYISSIRRGPKQHPSPELFAVIGKDPKVVFESNSQETQKRLCVAGAGFAYLARFMVEEELKAGSLLEFPLEETPTLTVFVARKKSAPLSFNGRAFLKEMQLDRKRA